MDRVSFLFLLTEFLVRYKHVEEDTALGPMVSLDMSELTRPRQKGDYLN